MKTALWMMLTIIVSSEIGCVYVQTDVTRLSPNHYDGKPKDCYIEVLDHVENGRPYEELGVINATGNGALETMLPEMKAKACSLGADAILLKNFSGATIREASKAYAIAIKFKTK